ncbi:MAG TPA: LytTR family DNA-binding domain-containing protein [Opitutaceae bacterium]|nr:LytTR family DNA-binding domain-containing protein [Opitutaceae bacterium]HND59988.1 LytTR family DNA-binding domain-containing protein [Opitutaceae bacterium]
MKSSSLATVPLPSTAVRTRVAVVDDEPTARRGVRLLLERDPSVEVVGEAADGAEAADLILREKPDLVFMDVQMPGCDGFQALAKVGVAAAPAVIFVTAYDEHALRAFEVNAVDYLLKPYDDTRFSAALQRGKEEVRRRQNDVVNTRLHQLLDYLQQSAPAAEENGADRILLKSSGEIFFLKAEEIDWIEAEGDYMKFHVGGRAHLMRETMARLEARLDPKRFIRIHRSTIVNIDRLRKLSPSFAGEYAVILHDGTKLKLSRGYHERIASLLKQSL